MIRKMNKYELKNLSPAKRQKLLLEELKQHKVLDVREAAKQLYTAEATIRRDFNKLAAAGLVRRTYGGAVLVDETDEKIPIYARESQDVEKKEALCRQAVELIQDGDTIILDSSTTVLHLIRYLKARKKLKIVTNGAKTAVLLADLQDAVVYCTGGRMREHNLSYVGQTAIDFIRNFHADTCFFSCRSLSERGLSDGSEEEVFLRRAMMDSSRQSVLMIDSSKCDTDSAFHICDADAVTHILCDCAVYQK